jgi:hypothetical protein
MFFGHIEREMLSAAIYGICENPQLPQNLYLLINQEQENRDIWECHHQNTLVVVEEVREHRGDRGDREDRGDKGDKVDKVDKVDRGESNF